MPNNLIQTIPRVRGFIILITLCSFAIPTLLYIGLDLRPVVLPSYWHQLLGALGFQCGFILVSASYIRRHKLSLSSICGRATKRDMLIALEFTAINIALTFVILYAIYYPLSLTAQFKSWVIELLFDVPKLIIYDGVGYPTLANIAMFISIVILAPLTEEFVFRGVLYARLSQKYSMWVGVFVSSLLFGLLHGEILSAALFGALLCYCYQVTGRLIVPILIHVLNNFAVWLITAWDVWQHGPNSIYSLADFQAEWRYGLYAGAALLVWLGVYIFRKQSLSARLNNGVHTPHLP